MSKEIEKALMDYKTNNYDNISIPDNIDVFIEKGIQQKKTHEKTQTRKRITMTAASLMIIVFLSSIRISPAFASYISNIPGLNYIVKLINHDKGLKIAIENNFIQPIGISDTHEDITLTVDNIIADESRMVIFYTVENKGDHLYLQLKNLELKNENGDILPVSFTFGNFIGINFNEERKNSGQIDISFQSDYDIPDNITLETKFSEAKQSWEKYSLEKINSGNDNIKDEDRFIDLESTWSIDIPIDKEKFRNLKEVYSVDKTISVHNQKIDIQQFVINPTRMELYVVYDENNPLKIFSIENLRITGESGEWKTITNGINASHLDENTRRYYFQSSYFTYPKELYLEGNGFYAIEKEHTEVVVDLKNKKLLKAPDEIKLQAVVQEDDGYLLHFNIPQYSGNMNFDILGWKFKDKKGQEFTAKRMGSGPSMKEAGYDDFHYSIPKNVDMDNIITIEIDHYPNYIAEPFKVRIK